MDNNLAKRKTLYVWIKLIASISLPMAVGIFTLVTTLQNRDIAQLYRNEDKQQHDIQRAADNAQAEDEQRETVYVDYIHDISRFRDENVHNWTHDKLLYIETKTLVALRKVDPYRKRQIFEFLRETRLLSTRHFLLRGADFKRIELDGSDYTLSYTTIVGSYFGNGSFTNCYFLKMTLAYSNFKYARFSLSTMIEIDCTGCRFDHVTLNNTLFIRSYFSSASFAYANMSNVQFYYTRLTNVNLTGAILSNTEITPNDSLINSILPNGSFSSIDERNLMNDVNNCSTSRWILHSGAVELQLMNNSTECWLVNRLNTSGVIYDFDISLYTLLINADQADFDFSLHRHNNTVEFGVAIHVANGRRGLFYFTRLESNHCLSTTCNLRVPVPVLSEITYIHVTMYEIGTTLSNFQFAIRKRTV